MQKEVAKWLLSEASERHCPAAWFLACTARHKPFSCPGYGWRMSRRWRRMRAWASSMLQAPSESSAWQNSLPFLQTAASLARHSSFSSLPAGVTLASWLGRHSSVFPLLWLKLPLAKEVVGQSPMPFNINTANPTMTGFLFPVSTAAALFGLLRQWVYTDTKYTLPHMTPCKSATSYWFWRDQGQGRTAQALWKKGQAKKNRKNCWRKRRDRQTACKC